MLWPVLASAECRTEFVDLKGDWGQARFSVEVADTMRERSTGLMHRESMPAMSGMLFVYPFAQSVGFWMRNTLIPLDMIFMDPSGTVTHVHHNAIPLDETPIRGGSGVKFVLEINGGMAARLGIIPGSQMRHPSVAANRAAWPCR
ncbi:MAG: DUF192 domain-containing protein [Thalassovita sp.]